MILLENLKDIPDNIDKVIINADKSYSDKHTNINDPDKFILINYEKQFFDESTKFTSNIKHVKFRHLFQYLSKIEISKSLDDTNKISEGQSTDKILQTVPILEWSGDFQSFILKNLVPNKIYRINYSYFPYWHTKDGIIFRGSGERIFFLATNNEAKFTYTRIYSISTWIGWLFTLIGLSFLGKNYIKRIKK